jgi:hypothetical protein
MKMAQPLLDAIFRRARARDVFLFSGREFQFCAAKKKI